VNDLLPILRLDPGKHSAITKRPSTTRPLSITNNAHYFAPRGANRKPPTLARRRPIQDRPDRPISNLVRVRRRYFLGCSSESQSPHSTSSVTTLSTTPTSPGNAPSPSAARSDSNHTLKVECLAGRFAWSDGSRRTRKDSVLLVARGSICRKPTAARRYVSNQSDR
jgi:hypothetical protein